MLLNGYCPDESRFGHNSCPMASKCTIAQPEDSLWNVRKHDRVTEKAHGGRGCEFIGEIPSQSIGARRVPTNRHCEKCKRRSNLVRSSCAYAKRDIHSNMLGALVLQRNMCFGWVWLWGNSSKLDMSGSGQVLWRRRGKRSRQHAHGREKSWTK